MFVPWFAPLLVPAWATMVIMDKMTGGALSKSADDYMKRDVDDRSKPRKPGHYKSER